MFVGVWVAVWVGEGVNVKVGVAEAVKVTVGVEVGSGEDVDVCVGCGVSDNTGKLSVFEQETMIPIKTMESMMMIKFRFIKAFLFIDFLYYRENDFSARLPIDPSATTR